MEWCAGGERASGCGDPCVGRSGYPRGLGPGTYTHNSVVEPDPPDQPSLSLEVEEYVPSEMTEQRTETPVFRLQRHLIKVGIDLAEEFVGCGLFELDNQWILGGEKPNMGQSEYLLFDGLCVIPNYGHGQSGLAGIVWLTWGNPVGFFPY